MAQFLSIADVLARGVEVTAEEAVALARGSIDFCQNEGDTTVPHGPPSPRSVLVGSDGSVRCRGCALPPTPLEIGILLDALVPRGSKTSVPGRLRYTIARALLESDGPPFETIGQLSDVLARYEQRDRLQIIRELFARATTGAARPMPLELSTERRRTPISSVDTWRSHIANAPRGLSAVSPADNGGRTGSPSFARGVVAAAAVAAAGLLALRADLPPWRSARRAGTVTTAAAPASEPRRAPPAPPTGHEGVAADPSVHLIAPNAPAPTLVRLADRADGPEFSPAFAGDGTALLFHTGRSVDHRSALKSIGGTTPGAPVMTILDDGARNYHVQPSPDGDFIAFDSDRDGERAVFIARRDGTHVTRVSGGGYAAVPTWAPDETRLAYVRAEPGRPYVWNLWQLSLVTGEESRVTHYAYGQTWSGSWFPDGQRIAYTHEDDLVIVNVLSGASQAFSSPVPGRLLRTPAVAPDGGSIAFQVFRDGVWLLRPSDHSMRRLLADGTAEEFAWSPDGRRVAFHSRRDGQWRIWIMPVPVAAVR
jgi:Tol biopolymer transport system component